MSSTANLNDTNPPAPAGAVNVAWQASTDYTGASGLPQRDVSANLKPFAGDAGSGGAPGAVPAPGPGDGAGGKFLKADGTWSAPPGGGGGGGSGTVTSVGLSAPPEFTVAGSPVTTSGTLALAKATQAAHAVWAGPTTGSPAAPTFRPLAGADMPLMTGDSGTGGTAGAVPAPPAGSAAAGAVMNAAGVWQTPYATREPTSITVPSKFTFLTDQLIIDSGVVVAINAGGLIDVLAGQGAAANLANVQAVAIPAIPFAGPAGISAAGDITLSPRAGQPGGITTIEGQSSEVVITQDFSGVSNGAWIDMSTDGPSGIGHGGPGVNPWAAYVPAASNYFSDAQAGDIVMKNGSSNSIRFGVSGAPAKMFVNSTGVHLASLADFANASAPITAAPPAVSTGSTGWKANIYSNSYAIGLAGFTFALLTGNWVSVFNGTNYPLNNATAALPDGNASVSFGGTPGNGAIFLSNATAGKPTEIQGAGSTVNTVVGSVFGIAQATVAWLLALDTAGNLGIAGTLHQASDERYKTTVPLDGVLNTLDAIQPVRYIWNDAYKEIHPNADPGVQIGLIAQEVAVKFPELTRTSEDGSMMSLNYPQVVAVAIQAIKELLERVKRLERAQGPQAKEQQA